MDTDTHTVSRNYYSFNPGNPLLAASPARGTIKSTEATMSSASVALQLFSIMPQVVQLLPYGSGNNGLPMNPTCRTPAIANISYERKSGNVVQGPFLVHSVTKTRVARCERISNIARTTTLRIERLCTRTPSQKVVV